MLQVGREGQHKDTAKECEVWGMRWGHRPEWIGEFWGGEFQRVTAATLKVLSLKVCWWVRGIMKRPVYEDCRLRDGCGGVTLLFQSTTLFEVTNRFVKLGYVVYFWNTMLQTKVIHNLASIQSVFRRVFRKSLLIDINHKYNIIINHYYYHHFRSQW